MKTQINQYTFNQLNQTKHRLVQDGQFSLFPHTHPDTAKQDTEYWFFSDIFNIYNNETTPTDNIDMTHTIKKNLYMPIDLSKNKTTLVPCDMDFLYKHIAQVKHAYKLGHHEYKRANDLQMTRYTCWCLSKFFGDQNFSYTYFMSPIIQQNMTFEMIEKLSYQFSRPYARDLLAKYSQRFNGLICELKGDLSIMNNKKIRSFFNGHDSKSLKATYGITSHQASILDFMGTYSLEFMTNGLSKAIMQFSKKNKNIYQFEEIMNQELIKARQDMITQTGIKPENDIYKTTTDKVKRELQNTENKFIKKYAQIKLH